MWQTAKLYGLTVKTCAPVTLVKDRNIARTTPPSSTVTMRGDGNCLFRTFSYMVFGVQSYHIIIRDYISDFMKKKNSELMKGIERQPIEQII